MSDDLARILETMAFKSQTPNQLATGIIETMMKGRDPSRWNYHRITERSVKLHIASLVKRYGNPGISRRKLLGIVMKRIRKIESKAIHKRRSELL